jgi:DNA-binding CsgD family transcriptional regulator
MKLDTGLLEELQKLYAKAWGTGLFISDTQGQLISKPTLDSSEWMERVLRDDRSIEKLQKLMIKMIQNTRPIYIDSWIHDFHFIAAPVILRTGQRLYVWIGPFAPEKSKRMLDQDTSILPREINGFDSMDIAEINESSHQMLLDGAEQFAILVCDYLSSRQYEHKLMDSLETVVDAAQCEHGKDTIDRILLACLKNSTQYDFWGYAYKNKLGRYTIQYVVGLETEGILGANFYEGEGYLGHTALTGESKVWNQIKFDPRSNFFASKGITLHQLCCCPIFIQDEQADGILFAGGRVAVEETSSIDFQLIKTMAILLGNNQSAAQSKDQLNIQMGRLSSITEVSKFLGSTTESRKVLFVLIDACINMIQETEFALILMSQQKGGKAQIVSRGLSDEQAEVYARDLAKRYMIKKTEDDEGKRILLNQENSDYCRLECPIIVGQETLGVIAVSVKRTQNLNDCKDLLSTLAIIGGLALETKAESSVDRLDHNSEYLLLAVRQADPDHYRVLREAEKFAKAFAVYQGYTNELMKEMTIVCRLLWYDVQLLEEAGFPNTIIHYIQEYIKMNETVEKQVESTIGINSYSICIQIVSLVFTYINHGKSLGKLNESSGIDQRLFEKFQEFLLHQRTAEQEFSLNRDIDSSSRMNKVVDLSSLRDWLRLSKREEEVLLLVMEGLGNKEIAKQLFISEHTVKNHMTSILNKLGVTDRNQAIAKIYQKLR